VVFSQGCSHEFSGAGDHKEVRGTLAAHFQKKASMIVTVNCSDEYREVMGDPCFETMEGHLMIEEIEEARQSS
jgi:hypothetical protein